MRAVVVLAIVAALAFAEADMNLTFIPGENLTTAFSFRWQKNSMIKTPQRIFPASRNITLPDYVYLWGSASINVNFTPTSISGDANSMVCFAFPPSASVYPFANLAYAAGDSATRVDPREFLTSIGSMQTSSVFKGGAVAMVALSVEELDSLGQATGNKAEFKSDTCVPREIKDGAVKGMTCTMTTETSPAEITITYITSSQAGILKYGETPVSPRSIEMIIEVDGFALTNRRNHARLNIALLTRNGVLTVEGNSISIEKDSEIVYSAVSKYAVIDGKVEEVQVSFSSELLVLDESSRATLNATLGVDYLYKIAHIDFPAGVESFVYDPALGTGPCVYGTYTPKNFMNSANSAVLSALVVLICSLFLLF